MISLSLPLTSKKLAWDSFHFPDNFIAGSLYIAALDIPSTVPAAPASIDGEVTLQYTLELFYQEKPTVAPFPQNPCLEGQRWRVESMESDPSKCCLKQYSRTSHDALYHKGVLGYIRVAESVDLARLQAVLGSDDSQAKKSHGMFSGNYVIEALYRLRKQGMLHIVFWDKEKLKAEFDRLYAVWKGKAGARKESGLLIAAPFVDLVCCEFTTREHQISTGCK
ncbi:hypothetical protein P691DRAFT_777527 [Macrolepiota fuliginosa MF-IS2]|uniref:Uncharacterized protein n=1 Tax=Macrolepiota fuliginosa MF-IS2 TaxID=1400762 RepID=A0A9P6C1D1_9AGAR|nr:hypothetical protein P691DRAFT_777527 [Macrolepiota fuliginosa MF-IS2]